MRKEVDALDNENILLGVELNLDNESGKSTLTQEQLGILDFMVGSVHDMPVAFLQLPDIEKEEIQDFFESFHQIHKNGFLHHPIRIWGHPFLHELQRFGDTYWADYMRPIYEDMLELCAKNKIAIELTPAYHRKCQDQPSTFTILDEMYAMAMKNPDVYFVTSSDAHSLGNLGEIAIPLDYVKKFSIPETRILEIKK